MYLKIVSIPTNMQNGVPPLIRLCQWKGTAPPRPCFPANIDILDSFLLFSALHLLEGRHSVP